MKQNKIYLLSKTKDYPESRPYHLYCQNLTPPQMRYIKRSLRVSTYEERQAIFQEAIKKYPRSLEFKRLAIAGDICFIYDELEKLERSERKNFPTKIPSSTATMALDSYHILKWEIAEYALQSGLLFEAKKHFSDLFKSDKNDRIGARYWLFAIYCLLYDWESAIRLYHYHSSHKADDVILLYMTIIALSTRRQKEAKQFLKKLHSVNPHLPELIDDDLFDLKDILTITRKEGYEPGTADALRWALFYLIPMISGRTNYIPTWIEQQIADFTPKVDTKHHSDLQRIQDALLNLKEDFESQRNPLYKGIPDSARRALRNAKITTLKDFKKYTEKDILNLKGVGKRSIEKLTENGVIFKQETQQ